MDAAELREWAAFYDLEPWGTEVDDLLNARTCEVIAAVNAGKGRKPKLADFLLFPDQQPKRKQTTEEMFFRFKMIAAAIENSRRPNG